MRDVILVILNSLRIKCHIRRPLRQAYVSKYFSKLHRILRPNCRVLACLVIITDIYMYVKCSRLQN